MVHRRRRRRRDCARPAGRGRRRVRAPPGRALRALRGDVPARRRRRLRRAAAAELRAPGAERSIRKHYQRRFSHLLVDEFRTPTCSSTSGCGFSPGPTPRCSPSATTTSRSTRSAARTSANMQHFERDFAGGRPVQLIKLEQNYRSHGHILDAANALIRHNQRATGQGPVDERRQGRAGARVRRADRPRRGRVRRRRGQRASRTRRSAVEVAMLYRGNAQSRRARARAVQRRAALPRLRRHALLRARRGEARARLSCGSSRSPRTTGRSCASSISRRAASARARSSNCRTSRAAAARACGEAAASGAARRRQGGQQPRDVHPDDRDAARRDRVAAAARGGRARDRRRRASRRTTRPRRTARTASRTSRSWSTPRRASCAGPGHRERCTDAVRPRRADAPIPEDGPAEGASDPLTAFLAHAALEAGETQEAEAGRALQLMTVHSAEGPRVPHGVRDRARGRPVPAREQPERDGRARGRAAAHVRRAHARAPALYLTHAQSRMLHGQTRYHIASRFIDEIPRDLIQWLSPARKRYGSIDVDEAEWGSIRGAPQAHRPAPAWRVGQRRAPRPSSASASSSTRKAAATTRAFRSISANRA